MIGVITISLIAPMYLRSLEQLAFKKDIERIADGGLSINVFGPPMLLSAESLSVTEDSVVTIFQDHIEDSYIGYETYIRAANSLVGWPDRPIPVKGGTGEIVARGFVHHLSGLDENVTLVSGRLPNSSIGDNTRVNEIEAVISVGTADRFKLTAGQQVEVTTDLMMKERLYVTITGIIKPDDPGSDYWGVATIFLNPAPLEESPPEGIRVASDDEMEPPIGLLVRREAIVNNVGNLYQSTVVRPAWFFFINPEKLVRWSLTEVRTKFESLQLEISKKVPESTISARSVLIPIREIERRSFFTRVPLMLLLVLMAMTIIFYLVTVVIYLARSRDKDSAVLRSRGVGFTRLARIYLLECLILVSIATAMGSVLSIVLVKLAGLLPYFSDITNYSMLPVKFDSDISMILFLAVLLCITLYLLPLIFGAQGSVVRERVGFARSATIPFLHRYNIDLAILLIGGVIFWELRSRGQLASGGLFKDVEVNETLLIAPVAFLVVVALTFMRFFPLGIRFIAGESIKIIDIFVGFLILAFITAILWTERTGVFSIDQGTVVLGCISFGATYFIVSKINRIYFKLSLYLLQIAILVGLYWQVSPETNELQFTFLLGFGFVVLAQPLFSFFMWIRTVTPIWMAVPMSHMSRSSSHYTWVIMLLVLASGLALLATTVGGTLQRSQKEQVLYRVASDIRIANLRSNRPGGLDGLEKAVKSIPGVTSVTRAFRSTGSIGPVSFELLGIEPSKFGNLSWYRSDFSDLSLPDVMNEIVISERLGPILIPKDSDRIGVWVRSERDFRNLSLWLLLKSPSGSLNSISLGKVKGAAGWQLLSTQISQKQILPAELISIHLSEPGQGNNNTPGEIWIDDVHVMAQGDDFPINIENFEGPLVWLPISSSELSSDTVEEISDYKHGGKKSLKFSFGKETVNNIRGIYRLPVTGAIPAVINSTLSDNVNVKAGDMLMARLSGLQVPVKIAGVIDNFPTMKADIDGFMLLDMEAILSHINVVGSAYIVNSNEFFVDKLSDSDPLDQIKNLIRYSANIYDVGKELEAINSDPLVGAGWKTMVLLALFVVFISSAFTYTAYLLLYRSRNIFEIGFLETMGLSRIQLKAILFFEHLAVVIIGLGLGSWAGFQMSKLMVGSLAVTDKGTAVAPPFILITDWILLVPTFCIMIILFLTMILLVSRSLGNLDLQSMARIGE